jgi:hypothetical protein
VDIEFVGAFTNVAVTPPAGFQVSKDESTWGTVAEYATAEDTTETVYFRAYSETAGTFDGDAVISTDELDDVNIELTLTVENFVISRTVKITPSSINFGRVEVGDSVTSLVTLSNEGTVPVGVASMTETEAFTNTLSTTVLQQKHPKNVTVYFDMRGNIKDNNGLYYTTDQGYGTAGFTTPEGRFFVCLDTPAIQDTYGSMVLDTNGAFITI